MVTKDPNGEIPAKKLTKIITKNRTVQFKKILQIMLLKNKQLKCDF